MLLVVADSQMSFAVRCARRVLADELAAQIRAGVGVLAEAALEYPGL